ncbi:unnamed protein product [Moneuplotes crassus]|uniref:Uncharacterized protein n=1 Tax=Euplotes crassus TaxID=5936 RepID=A0AAD1UQK6_EUPCR|nr:unnamed protein product [Moneuplotes crassus]
MTSLKYLLRFLNLFCYLISDLSLWIGTNLSEIMKKINFLIYKILKRKKIVKSKIILKRKCSCIKFWIPLILVKINGLLHSHDDPDNKNIIVANEFVSDCYSKLIRAAKSYQTAHKIWKFNAYFWMLRWKNKFVNDLHAKLVILVIKNSGLDKLNLDSCGLFKKIISKTGNLLKPEECDVEFVRKNIPIEKREKCGFEKNLPQRNQKIFAYFTKQIKSLDNLSNKDYKNSKETKNKNPCHKNYEDFEHSSLITTNSDPMFIKIIISKFLRIYKSASESSETKLKFTRKLQLLINKLIEIISSLEPDFQNQGYIYHSLVMLNEILCNKELLDNQEIAYMFYTKHATNTFFSLILKEYNFIECARNMRIFAYEILIKLMLFNSNDAKKSFRVWTHSNDNKNRLFKRMIKLINQFSAYFINTSISKRIQDCLEKTDFRELSLSLQWLTLLCQNGKYWQDYLSSQDNSAKNHNIIRAIIELLRTSVIQLKLEYVLQLLKEIVKFITATLNGRNEVLAIRYVNSSLINHCMKILKKEKMKNEKEFLSGLKKLSFVRKDPQEIKKDAKAEESKSIKEIRALNELKHEILRMINALVFPSTEHQIKSLKNEEIINNIMILNYTQFRIFKDDMYTQELVNKYSSLSKVYNINLGFQSYYLISKLWDNNGIVPSNCVQRKDAEGMWTMYWKLAKGLYKKLKFYKRRYSPIKLKKYERFISNKNLRAEATDFFDSYSSSVEIVLPNGEIVKRYFQILPCFLSFTQSGKDEFWLKANLDNSKTAVCSFVKYATDKVEELFIQQEIQDLPVCPKDVAKEESWLTDVTRFLVITINIILLFGLEINEGEILDKPSIFGLHYKTTRATLLILCSLLFVLFCYIFAIQGTIIMRLMAKRAVRGKKRRNELVTFSRTFRYVIENKEETLEQRNFWCLLPCLIFSFIGIAFNYFWFAFTLLYMVIFSPQILEMTNALWKPKKRIFSTIILSSMVLYWFAILAYVYFGSDFNYIIPDSNQTLTRTLAVIFDSWYKFGLGAFLTENGKSAIVEEINGENQYNLNGARLAFDFGFFFIVPTLLLSILSGIIIDNFGTRRSVSDNIRKKQSEQCFICGKASSDLPDFEEHCKFHHNIWDYMYYIGFIKAMTVTQRTDYRDIYVMQCLTLNQNDWFPAYNELKKKDKLRQEEQPGGIGK